MRLAKRMLDVSAISKLVTENSIYFDSETNMPAPTEDKGTVQTITLIEGRDELMVFEAGDFYIRLKTIWNRKNPEIYQTKGGKVIQLNKDGSYTTNAAQIRNMD